MRLINAVLALLFVAFGVVFGALNRVPVRIELGFRTFEDVTLGTTLLAAVLFGALLAGLVLTVGVIWPLRLKLRQRPKGVVADAPPVAAGHD